MTVTSIAQDSLDIGAGATFTIAPIAGGPLAARWIVDRGSRTVHVGNASAGRNGTGHLLASQPVRIKGEVVGAAIQLPPQQADKHIVGITD